MIILAATPACNCSTYLSTYFTYYILTYLQLPTSLSETKPFHHIYDENDEPGSHPNEKNGVNGGLRTLPRASQRHSFDHLLLAWTIARCEGLHFHAASLRFLFGRSVPIAPPLALLPFLPQVLGLYCVDYHHLTEIAITLLLKSFFFMCSALSALSLLYSLHTDNSAMLHANYDGFLYSRGLVAWLRTIRNRRFYG